MVNREIVRRGAVILFCDYVVRLLRIWDHTVGINYTYITVYYSQLENMLRITFGDYLLFTIYEEQYLNLKTLMSKSKLDL